ncbi:hypothetical protein GUITHDRAFT_147552 [Guillardia theta CCMP2712]|uniref:Uncharacterized protein n=1 Tax=Guillardia theta (strain CCMP2712) TaxID=905079 RepID=L1ICM4_GUITC|nr:hypothetical protein GUITHDRAFT_147552 [Guillardia theta CCMP2712]EKX33983.1 hypothetical protein GUITHDRAFT_147552 [Guillardia theta CCMP2712]|eukprot:XP_005820963.1 hypothetical protein GUITHDRAFT_147552 [Guillardia theta CCMP2712]
MAAAELKEKSEKMSLDIEAVEASNQQLADAREEANKLYELQVEERGLNLDLHLHLHSVRLIFLALLGECVTYGRELKLVSALTSVRERGDKLRQQRKSEEARRKQQMQELRAAVSEYEKKIQEIETAKMEETRRSLQGEYEERQREVKDSVMKKEARLADRLRAAASDDQLDEIRRQE